MAAASLEALTRIAPLAPGLAKLQRDALQRLDSRVRRAAVAGLARGAGDRADALALAAALDDVDWDVRCDAARALAGLGDKAAPALEVLANVLEGPDQILAVLACQALAAQGPGAVQAVPQLRAALEDGSQAVRRAAQEALHAVNEGG